MFSGLKEAARPSQWRSTITANFSNGWSRCHLSDSFQLAKNFRAEASYLKSHSREKDSLSR